MSAATLPVLLILLAVYIVAVRFGDLALAGWPVLLAFLGWLVFIWRWTRSQQVTSAEAARFLDRTLDLDERVSTCIELVNATKFVRTRAARHRMHYALAADAARALEERLHLLPGRFAFRWTRGSMVALVVAFVALTGAMALPAYVELARSDRSSLVKALQDQLAQVRALRTEIEANQQISADLRASILNELATLERNLESSSLDQAAGIATLADAEQRLRSLLQTPSADFDGLVVAAQLVWNSVAQNFEWDSEQWLSATDLGRASEASLFLSDSIEGINPDAERRVASSLERASSQASGRDSDLSGLLAEGSAGMRTRDYVPASRALAKASQIFAEANNQREDAVALENVLSQLNKGREQIAQAGRPQSKKAQVGFRRRGPSADATSPTPDLENFGADAGATQEGAGGTQNIADMSGMGPVIGQSNVASYSGSPSSSDSGGQPSQAPGEDGSTSPGSGPGGGTSGQDGGQSAASDQTTGGGSAGGAATDSGEQGTLSGSISGPVGGAGGAISRVPSPSGRGAPPGDSSDAPGSPEDGDSGGGGEQVYIPGPGEGEELGPPTSGESGDDKADDASSDGVGGRTGQGTGSGEEVTSGRGQGGAVRVQTPYREVIAEYAREATEAIERAYVPADAKQYVKDYFAELGK